jgi:hypothetical protein
MELVVQLYIYKINDSDSDHIKFGKELRQYEINDCLIRNIHNPIFSKIHILVESDIELSYFKTLICEIQESTKCIFVIFGRQPYYSDFVQYINNTIPPDTSVCIMNSDIFMGHVSLDFISKELDYNTFISLTRHEYTDDSHSSCNVNTCHLIYKYHGSHDAFIFKTPVPSNYNYNYVNIPQNIGGAEAIFMKSWELTGKQLKNLCFDIPIYHRHKNNFYISNYDTLATHELCNIRPRVPDGRKDIESQMIKMF